MKRLKHKKNIKHKGDITSQKSGKFLVSPVVTTKSMTAVKKKLKLINRTKSEYIIQKITSAETCESLEAPPLKMYIY